MAIVAAAESWSSVWREKVINVQDREAKGILRQPSEFRNTVHWKVLM